MVDRVRKVQSNFYKANKVKLNYENILKADKSTAAIF